MSFYANNNEAANKGSLNLRLYTMSVLLFEGVLERAVLFQLV